MGYILWFVTLLRACDVTQVLKFYPELEAVKKRRILKILDARHVNYYIKNHFCFFLWTFCAF